MKSGQSAPQTPSTSGPPHLNSGDRLSRAEFERRYQAHPEIGKAELVGGVDYVSSPIQYEKHAEFVEQLQARLEE